MGPDGEANDSKNIRRRVYDALNVMIALNIIHKENKELSFVGLPTNASTDLAAEEQQVLLRRQRIQAKRDQLNTLLLQVGGTPVCLWSLK